MAVIDYQDDYAGTNRPRTDPVFSGYASPGYQPSGGSSPTSNPYTTPDTTYRPPSGNTGVSGYGGGFPVPPVVQNPFQPPPQGGGGGFNYNTFRDTAETLGRQYSGSLADFQNNIFPQLASQFPGIERFGSKGDKIRLPNGEVIDAVISAGLGGRGYNWSIESGGGGYSGDPLINGYLDLSSEAIQRLMGPQGMNPVLQQAVDMLTRVFNQRDVGYEQFSDIAGRRISQLRNPLFAMAPGSPGTTQAAAPVPTIPRPAGGEDWVPTMDGSGWVPSTHPLAWQPATGNGTVAISPDALRNSALLRTKFTEPLEQQRAASQQRALERASSRGLGQGSGVIEQQAQSIDQGFDRMLGEGYRDLMLQEVEANEAREREAVAIGQALASLSGRNSGAQLGAAGQLAGIGSGLQSDAIRNLLSAVGISQQNAQLPFQTLNAQESAYNTVNNTQTPQADPMTSLIQFMMTLGQQGEGLYNNALGQDNAFWQTLFQAIPGLIGAFQPQQPQSNAGA